MVKPPPLGSFPIEKPPVHPPDSILPLDPDSNSHPIEGINNNNINNNNNNSATSITQNQEIRRRSRSQSASVSKVQIALDQAKAGQEAEEQQHQHDGNPPEEDDDDQGTVDEDGGIIRCICSIDDDDGFTIQCDRCLVWQHCACFKMSSDNVPEEYLCEQCDPREVDVAFASMIQQRRREEEKVKESFGLGADSIGRESGNQDLFDSTNSGNENFTGFDKNGNPIPNLNSSRNAEISTSHVSVSTSSFKEERTASNKRKLSQTLDLSNASFSGDFNSVSTSQASLNQSSSSTGGGGRGGKRKQSQSRKQSSSSDLTISTNLSRLQTPREENNDLFFNPLNSNSNTPVSSIGNFNFDPTSGVPTSLNTNLTLNSSSLENLENFKSWNIEYTPISRNIVVERTVLERIKDALDLFKREGLGPLESIVVGNTGTSQVARNMNSANGNRISVPIAPKNSRRDSYKFNPASSEHMNEKDKLSSLSFKSTKGTELGLSFVSNECIPVEIKLRVDESSSSSSLSQFNSKVYIKQISEIASGSIFSNLNPNSTYSNSTNLSSTLNPSLSIPNSNYQSHSTSFSGISNGPNRSFSKPIMHGLFAESNISSGNFISELKGELLTLENYKKNPLNQYGGFGTPKPHVRFLPKPFSLAVDSRRFGNEARFIRSACHPNSVLRPVLLKKIRSKSNATGNGNGNVVPSGFRTPIMSHSISREQSPMVFSKLGIENKDFFNQKPFPPNPDTTQGEADEAGGDEEVEEEIELIFGIFALNDIQKTHEITLGWEWDDNHIVHFLPELIRNPAIYANANSGPNLSSNLLKNSSNSPISANPLTSASSSSKRNSANSTSRSRLGSDLQDLNGFQNPYPYLNTMFSYKMNQTLVCILSSSLCACIGSASPPSNLGLNSGNNGSASSNNGKKQDCAVAQMLRVANGMALLNVDFNRNASLGTGFTAGKGKKPKLPDFKPLVGIKRGWDFNHKFSSSIPLNTEDQKLGKVTSRRRNSERSDESKELEDIIKGKKIITSNFRNQLKESLLSKRIEMVSEEDVLKALEKENSKSIKRQREEGERRREEDSIREESDSEIKNREEGEGSDSQASSLTDPLSGLSDIEEDEIDEEELRINRREQENVDQDIKRIESKEEDEDDEDEDDGPSVLPLKKRISGTRIKASNNSDQEEEDHTPNFSNPSTSKNNHLHKDPVLNLQGKRKRNRTKDSNDSLQFSHGSHHQNKKSNLRNQKRVKGFSDDDGDSSDASHEAVQERSRVKKKARIEKDLPSSSSSAKRKRKDSSSKRSMDQSSPLSSLADADSESDSQGENQEDDDEELSQESRNSSLSSAPEEEEESESDDDDDDEDEAQSESGSDQDEEFIQKKSSSVLDESSSPVRGPGRRKSLDQSSLSNNKSKKKSSRVLDDSSQEDEENGGDHDQDESDQEEQEDEETSLPKSRRGKESTEITPSRKKAKAKEIARRRALAELADPETSEEEENEEEGKNRKGKSKEKIKKSKIKEKEKEKERLKKKENEIKARKREREVKKEKENQKKKKEKQRRVISSEEEENDGTQSSDSGSSSSSTDVRSRKKSKLQRDRTPTGRGPETEENEETKDSVQTQPLETQNAIEAQPAPDPTPAPDPPKPEPPRAKLSLAEYKKRLAERKVPTTSISTSTPSAAEGGMPSPSEPPTPSSATSTSHLSQVSGISKNPLPSFSKVSSASSTPSVSTPTTAGFFASIGAPTALKSVEIPKSPPTPSRPLASIPSSASSSANAVSSTSTSSATSTSTSTSTSSSTSSSIRQPWVPPSLPSKISSSSSSITSATPKIPIPSPSPSPSITPAPSVTPASRDSISQESSSRPIPPPVSSDSSPTKPSPTKPSDSARGNRERQSSNPFSWGSAHQRNLSVSAGPNFASSAPQPPVQPRARSSSTATASQISSTPSLSINTSPTKDPPPASPRASNSIPSSPRISSTFNEPRPPTAPAAALPTKSIPSGFRPLNPVSSSQVQDAPFSPASATSTASSMSSKFNPPRGPKALINSVVPPTAPTGPGNHTSSISSNSSVPPTRPAPPTRPPAGPSVQNRAARAESVGSETPGGWRSIAGHSAINPSSRSQNSRSGSPDQPSSNHPILPHHRNSIDSPSSSIRGPGPPPHRGGNYGMGYRGRGVSSGSIDRERERDWEWERERNWDSRERDRERPISPPSERPPPPLRPSMTSIHSAPTKPSSGSPWSERVQSSRPIGPATGHSSSSIPLGAAPPPPSPSRGGFARGAGWGNRARGSFRGRANTRGGR